MERDRGACYSGGKFREHRAALIGLVILIYFLTHDEDVVLSQDRLSEVSIVGFSSSWPFSYQPRSHEVEYSFNL